MYFGMCNWCDVHTPIISISASHFLHLICTSIRISSLPPSCSEVTASDCLISSRGIGDIRSNPVPTSPKSQQRGGDQLGWRAVGRLRSVSVKKRPDYRKAYSRWALRSQHISLISGDPTIQQVKIDDSDICAGFRFVSLKEIFEENNLKKLTFTFVVLFNIFISSQSGWLGICQIRKSWKWSWNSWRRKLAQLDHQ